MVLLRPLQPAPFYMGLNDKSLLSSRRDNTAVKTNSMNSSANKSRAQVSTQIRFSGGTYEQCKANALPSFLNISLSFGGPSYMGIVKTLKELSPPTLIITAAGNAAPKRYC